MLKKFSNKIIIISLVLAIFVTSCANKKIEAQFFENQDFLTDQWRNITDKTETLMDDMDDSERLELISQLQGELELYDKNLKVQDEYIRENREALTKRKVNTELKLAQIDSSFFELELQQKKVNTYEKLIVDIDKLQEQYNEEVISFEKLKAEIESEEISKEDKLAKIDEMKAYATEIDSHMMSFKSFLGINSMDLETLGYDPDPLKQDVEDKRNEIYSYKSTLYDKKYELENTMLYDLEIRHLPYVMAGVYNQYPALNYSLIEYEYTNNEAHPVTVTFNAQIKGHTTYGTVTETFEAGETKIVKQTPQIYSYIADDITEMKYADLYYYVTQDYKKIAEDTKPIKMYAKDTMVWAVQSNDEWVSTAYLIGAWVTPHIEKVDQIIRVAAELKSNRAMTGYQCGTCTLPADFTEYSGDEVEAIYNVVQAMGITYINSPVSFSSNQEASQRIKLPSESIDLASANCIDGVLLFASALENIGMNPYIALVPGHAFICWDVAAESEMGIDCFETTMVGSSTYEQANAAGRLEYTEYKSKGELTLLPIKGIRQLGIIPME
ncbi:hypothetical protein HOC50_05855 [archaeon]|jgi:hypothetical protein|nr:hypothetical protein [archaeon]MBT5423436.1 hypothetical protein [archaeon]